jgi:CheY-like chemotaxis protein
MDLGLPGTDGWATITALRADERTRDVPVVILSGTDPTPTPADVTAWLTKPLDLTGLLSTLNNAVNTGETRPCVLVIEDDPALKQVLVAMLTRHDVIAVTASTGHEALRLSHHIAPDLLLLDLFLPDLDGFALVNSLREDPRLRRVPMVVYSALDLDDHDKQRLRLGPTEFLTKAPAAPTRSNDRYWPCSTASSPHPRRRWAKTDDRQPGSRAQPPSECLGAPPANPGPHSIRDRSGGSTAACDQTCTVVKPLTCAPGSLSSAPPDLTAVCSIAS